MPFPAAAHSPIEGIEGFYSGLLHPVSTPAQALVLLAVGLMAGGFRPAEARWPVGLYMTAVLGGVACGAYLTPAATAMFATALVAAAMAALAPGRGLSLASCLAALGGASIGLLSLADPGPPMDRIVTSLGAVVGACIGLLYIFAFTRFVQDRYTVDWVPVAFRVAAAWIAAVSLLMTLMEFVPE
ncbi:hypothetical protein [Tropicimonas sp. S265A]|uniref:hypothetical protein n=1 Tax=Tropicimonas sp. S265A TaxID=3415134 RepID=UPI003C7DEE4B